MNFVNTMKGANANRLNASAQEAIRIREVNYLKNKQGTQCQAATIFMLSLSAIKKIWKRYLQNGETGLQAQQRGPQTSVARLRPEQVELIAKYIRTATPDDLGFPYPLWTAAAVRELIKKRPQ